MSTKLKIIGQHLLRYLLTLFIASIIIFVALRIIPGNPAEIALGITATPESVAQLEAEMGLNRPIIAQYFSWIGGILTGDFGTSLTSGENISTMVIDRFSVSLLLTIPAMILAILIAVPLGMWAARRAAQVDGVAITALSQIGIAIPSFLAGILLVAVFAVQLGWLPPNGWSVPSQDFSGFVKRLILPVISLGIVQAAILTRYVRSAILEVMNEDYMRTARSQGMSKGATLWVHGLRNAALPLLTVTGLQLSSLLMGAVVIEKVFVIPGLGTMLLNAVTSRDLPTVQTIVMLLVIIAIVINAVVDATYILVDPRTRRKG